MLTQTDNFFASGTDLKIACRVNDILHVKFWLSNKEFKDNDIKVLEQAYKIACANGSLEVIQYLMTSKDFSPNIRSVRGLDDIFRNKDEKVINWLVFDFNMRKCGAVEEVLIEMSDQDYAKYIERLFEKRELNKKLKNDLEQSLKSQNSNNKSKI